MKEKIYLKNGINIAILISIITLFYKLIDFAKITKYFPLDQINDMSSYMAQLFFLKSCGFHNICNYWYNGFISFSFSPPGWYFFSYPFYLITGDVKLALFISQIISYTLAFLIIFFLFGKNLNLSYKKRIIYFLFTFANAIVIGSFIRLGRVHELLTWVLFLFLLFLFLYYKENKLNINFFIVPLIFSLILITYPSTAVLASLLFLGLFLIKPWKERIYIIIAYLISLIIASFWLIPFILNISKSSIPHLKQATWVFQISGGNLYTFIASLIIPLLVLITFYFYYLGIKNKKEIIFFSPILVLSILFLLKLTAFLPIINTIFPDPLMIFMIFFIGLFLLKTKTNKKVINLLISLFIIAFLITSSAFSLFYTKGFINPNNELNRDILKSINQVETSFVILGNIPKTSYEKAIYSYAAIYKNKSTPEGWYPQLAERHYVEEIREYMDTKNLNCNDHKNFFKKFNVTDIIYIKGIKNELEECNLKIKHETDTVYLFNAA